MKLLRSVPRVVPRLFSASCLPRRPRSSTPNQGWVLGLAVRLKQLLQIPQLSGRHQPRQG